MSFVQISTHAYNHDGSAMIKNVKFRNIHVARTWKTTAKCSIVQYCNNNNYENIHMIEVFV